MHQNQKPSFQICDPNLKHMVYALCILQHIRWAATACILHALVRFHMQGTQYGMAKSMQAHSPTNGPASRRNRHERSRRSRGAFAVPQQVNLDSHKQCKDMCTASGLGPWEQPPAPPDIKVDLLPHSAKQLLSPGQESSKTGFCECQR